MTDPGASPRPPSGENGAPKRRWSSIPQTEPTDSIAAETAIPPADLPVVVESLAEHRAAPRQRRWTASIAASELATSGASSSPAAHRGITGTAHDAISPFTSLVSTPQPVSRTPSVVHALAVVPATTTSEAPVERPVAPIASTSESNAPSPSRRLGGAAARTGLVTALSRVIGLVRILVISMVLGTTYLGNTFQSSNSVSNVLFELLAAGGLSAVLVPALVRGIHSVRETERIANGILGVATLGLGFLILVGELAAPLIGRVLASGAPSAIAADQRELSTFLVRCFIPQIALYGYGAVATAVLHARRQFVVAAAAPIANTLAMVVFFVLFRIHAGADPGLRLDTTSKWLLAGAGTGGVIAFVLALGIPVWRAGLRLRPSLQLRDEHVRALVGHAGWGILLNSIGGLLAAALIVAGNVVEGGVVAFQVAFVLFLAPYAILSRPLESASLPEFTDNADDADADALEHTVHWTLESLGLLIAPAAVLLMVLARPGLIALDLGLDRRGGMLVAAALAGLAVGLVPYSIFLVMARVFYALNDSKTPALVSLLCGATGVLTILLARVALDGRALVAALGVGHSVAFGVGAVVLGATLRNRLGIRLLYWRSVAPVGIAAALGVAMWIAVRSADDGTQLTSFVICVVATVLYMVLYLGVTTVTRCGFRRFQPKPS